MENKIDFREGAILLVDKPLHWTSFNVVSKLKYVLRKLYGIKKFKVGHAGTLDPLATGLLIVCTGKYTKKIPELQDGTKEYTGTIELGATTPSYDLETEIDQKFSVEHIKEQDVLEVAKKLTGELNQAPPVFSAKKVEGKRAYDLARAGKEVILKKNIVTVHEFEITHVNIPELSFRIVCSKGTYIRSLAHDLGKLLNNGAHLTSLRRTKSGAFDIKQSLSVEETVFKIEDTAIKNSD